MRTWKILTVAILAITAVALTTASVFAYMGRPGYYTPYTTSTGTTGTYSSGTGSYGTYGGGMMGGYSYYVAPPVTTGQPQTTTPSTTTSTTPTYPYQSGGWGCPGMRARLGYTAPPVYTSPTTAPLNITTAVAIAQNYVTSTGNANLAVSQVEEYTLNFYVVVKEKDTGIGAFELLVDKYTGVISPEMGPNMMWNTKYGMMSGGMMGWLTGTTTTPATATVEQAKTNAQQYLNTYYPGTTAGDAQAFYGYYHIEVLSSGKVYGMLSVNSYTGQVWYHTWHGTFIQEIDLS